MPITKPPKSKDNAESKKATDFISGKKAKTESIQISLGLPTKLLNQIDERAEELSISRAAFIKQSCALFLERTN